MADAAPRSFFDDILDVAENIVDGAGAVVHGNRAHVVEAKAAPRRPQVPPFTIVEAIEDGDDVYIVTNTIERATCSTRALAERICAALAGGG